MKNLLTVNRIVRTKYAKQILPLLLLPVLFSAVNLKAQTPWTEAWNATPAMTYLVDENGDAVVPGDRGSWEILASYTDTPVCIVENNSGNKRLKLLCRDAFSHTEATFYSYPVGIPLNSGTKLAISLTGAITNATWNGSFPSFFPPPGHNTHLHLEDNNGNRMIYIFQRASNYVAHNEPLPMIHAITGQLLNVRYREVLVDTPNSLGGNYVFDLYADFIASTGTNPIGNSIHFIDFDLGGQGYATIDDLKIGTGIVGTAPGFTTQPTNTTVNASTSASFNVICSGTSPLIFQWQKNGTNISGATNPSLFFPSAQTNDIGSYRIIVANAYGSLTSSIASLVVISVPSIPTNSADGVPVWTNIFAGIGNYGSPDQIVTTKGDDVIVAGMVSTTFSIWTFSVIKYSSSGAALWTNYYQGQSANALEVDEFDNVIVTGSAGGGNGLVTIKYSGVGIPLWTNAIGYSGDGTDIAIDAEGNAYVTGRASSFEWSGLVAATVKYSRDGLPLWTNYFRSSQNYASGSCVKLSGETNIYVTAISDRGSGFPPYDYVTIKYSSDGLALWTNLFDGQGLGFEDNVAQMAIDGVGNVYVTGGSVSSSGTLDVSTIKYLSSGARVWTNRFNGSGNGNDDGFGIAVDKSNNIYVAGDATRVGNKDCVLLKYSSTGVPLWTNYFAGTGNGYDTLFDVVVDSSGNLIVTGETTGTNATSELLAIKYSSSGNGLWTNRFSSYAVDDSGGESLAVDSRGNVFVTGYTIGSGGIWRIATIKYLSASAVPYLRVAPSGAATATLISEGIPNSSYVIQFATNLSNSAWFPLATNVATANGTWSNSISTTPNSQRFYRIKAP